MCGFSGIFLYNFHAVGLAVTRQYRVFGVPGRSHGLFPEITMEYDVVDIVS